MRWKIIQRFPDYAVSDTGKIMRITKSKKAIPGQIMKQRVTPKGYLYIRLRKNRKRYSVLVHRLVLIAFVGINQDRKECNHKDGVKSNNNLDNLEWVTTKENSQHAVRTGLYNGWDIKNRKQYGENNLQAKLVTGQVLKIKKLLKTGEITQRAIASLFNISYQHVSDIKRGRRWAHL